MSGGGCTFHRRTASIVELQSKQGDIMTKAPRPNPNEKLVPVFDTEQEPEALVVQGLLESAGIESNLTSRDAQQDILPGVGGTLILVREEDAGEAKRLIEESRSPVKESTASQG
jgi:hypothetical protein